MIRLLSVGFGKVRATTCYTYLLLWLILVSIGLYWFLNHSPSGGLSALAQSGFGYIESNEIEAINDRVGSGESDSQGSTKHVWNPITIKSSGSVTSAFKSSEADEKSNVRKKSEKSDNHDVGETIEAWMKTKGARGSSKVTRICNPVEDIVSKDENIHPPEFKLEALVIVFRHGDRGPLTHIGHRNISHINCAAKSPDLDNFMKFSTDAVSKLPGYSQFIGAFHSFPKVPTNKFCSLGQLTQLGSHQLLTLGKMIRSTYKSTFFDVDPSSLVLGNSAATATHTSNHLPFKVLAYSTRYRRTFQSLFAFLFGLLGPKDMFQSATIRESQSITFCFHDCSCRRADKLKKVATKQHKMKSEYKAEMNKLVANLNTILGTGKSKKAGSSLLDSLLVYPCHKMELPCQEDNHKRKGVKYLYKAIQKLSLQTQTTISSPCVSLDNLESLVNFVKLENMSLKDSKAHLKYHLLSSYGLLKEIVNVALKMTSGGGSPENNNKQQETNRNYDGKPFYTAPLAASSSLYSSMGTGNGNGGFGRKISKKTKILVFSGHDTTLQSLTSALLGLSTEHPDTQLPPFASRLIFEFYRKTTSSPNSPRNHYFRVIFNGVSVTHLITFCKYNSEVSDNLYSNNNSKTRQSNEFENEKKTSPKASFMCPVEFLVRFIHDHYFEPFGNTTNFKDACQL